MKNIKEITISIFAIIGFFTIITGFTNNTETATQQTYGTPESHVWEIQCYDGGGSADSGRCYQYNKITGEVRMLSKKWKGAAWKVMPQE